IGRKGQTNNFVDISSSSQLRAEIFQRTLPSEFPNFVKRMLPSYVTGGFCLRAFQKKCVSHLPNHDDNVILVDEDEFSTKYLIDKNRLSVWGGGGGWRGFSIAHNLVENDVLVFQLIETCKFKVYILRENCLSQVDVVVVLMDFTVKAHN
ncbi:hypothetical protein MTR67_006146, partial [Solanum verrucosum]